MRVTHHITISLIAGIVGGAVLVLVSGVLMTQLKDASESSGHASKDVQLVGTFVRNSDEMLIVVDLLTADSSGLFVMAEQVNEKCRWNIKELAASRLPRPLRLQTDSRSAPA